MSRKYFPTFNEWDLHEIYTRIITARTRSEIKNTKHTAVCMLQGSQTYDEWFNNYVKPPQGGIMQLLCRHGMSDLFLQINWIEKIKNKKRKEDEICKFKYEQLNHIYPTMDDNQLDIKYHRIFQLKKLRDFEFDINDQIQSLERLGRKFTQNRFKFDSKLKEELIENSRTRSQRQRALKL